MAHSAFRLVPLLIGPPQSVVEVSYYWNLSLIMDLPASNSSFSGFGLQHVALYDMGQLYSKIDILLLQIHVRKQRVKNVYCVLS
jgi:hypothetical protein